QGSRHAGYLVRAGGVSLQRASKKPAAAASATSASASGRGEPGQRSHTCPLHLEPRAGSAGRGRCRHDSARAS
ncbi:hypothetical protein SORBI_3006G245000, partial [Sorghum bicolor]